VDNWPIVGFGLYKLWIAVAKLNIMEIVFENRRFGGGFVACKQRVSAYA
jgi:hypothetical protein